VNDVFEKQIEGNTLPVDALPGLAATSPLRAYWDICSKRRWEILTSLIVVPVAVAIFSFKMKPVYRSTARLEIEAASPELRSIDEPYQTVPTDESFLKTQVQVLASDRLAWQTIQDLHLDSAPAFSAGVLDAREASDPERAQNLLIAAFAKHLHAALTPNSHTVQVSFESTDAEVASQVVNTLVNDYVEYNFRTKYDAARQASGWMEQQLDELRAKVEKSQRALVDYERKNAIVNVSDRQNVVEARLEDLNKDLTSAENDLAQKRSLNDLVKSDPSKVSLVTQDDLLERLEEKEADLKTQYVDTLAQYGPRFPRVTRLRDQVKEIESLIERERRQDAERIQSEFRVATDRVSLLSASVARQKVEVGDLNQLLIQHNLLQRDFETNQQLYASLLQHLKDATVSAGLRATNVHVVDPARPETIPVRPKKLFNVALGTLVGLLIGVTLAFIQEGLDYSIKTAEEVERLTGAPSLAIIPAAGLVDPHPYGWFPRKNSNGSHNGTAALALLKEPASAVAEAYRALRTSILFSTAPRPPQLLLVTSSQPQEGKTSTSFNLSLALAQRGSRVLLVDADLRKPGVARSLDIPNDRGLSGVLTGAHPLEEALQQIEAVPNLWVLPAGPRPPNPAELLSSPRMEQLLGELRERFEHVVLDSPPLLMVTDATVLATLADGVILIVESGVTARDALARSHRILKIAGGRVLGVVMNKVQLGQDGYHYGPYARSYRYYRYEDADAPVSRSN
jgi:polysaccharide biosynthesis transport protein